MKLTSLALSLFLPILCFDSIAETPPRSPDYCGTMICLEISAFSDVEIVRSTTRIGTHPEQSEIEIESNHGKVKILVETISRDMQCGPSHALYLAQAERGLKTEAFIAGPDEGTCLHVTLIFKDDMRGKNHVDLPVTAIWAVDRVPSTFWNKGYALRLGPQVDIIHSDSARINSRP